jgi:hypothetical protein
LGVGTNAPATSLDVNGSIRTGVNLTVVGEIQNPTVGVVNINGELRVASPNVSIGLTSYPARLAVRGSGSTSATTSLLVQNSAGSDLIRINDVGLFQLGGTTSAFPAIQRNLSEVRFRLADDSSFCNIRTRQHRFENASVLSDVADGVMIMANNAVNDFGRLCLGGTTASFPALKRSSTTLQSRLADDSGFAPLQGKLTTDSAYVASTQIATGYITIYDSTGTAYKVLVST